MRFAIRRLQCDNSLVRQILSYLRISILVSLACGIFFSEIQAGAVEPLPPAKSPSNKCLEELKSAATVHGRVPEGFEVLVFTERTLIGRWKNQPPRYMPSTELPDNPWGYTILSKVDYSRLGIISIRQKGERGEIPLTFASDAQGKGIGTEVKYAILCYAFDDLKVNDVKAFIAETNSASRALHIKLGFKQQAHSPTWILTREDFEKIREDFRRQEAEGESPFLPRSTSRP